MEASSFEQKMGLMDVNEGAEYSEEELFSNQIEDNKMMNTKITEVLETKDNNGASAVTDFRYDKDHIAAVLEYCAKGLREGGIVINDSKSASQKIVQDASVQSKALVNNSGIVQNTNIEAAAKRQPYRLKAEIFDVQVKLDTKSGKEYVQWGLIPIDLDAPQDKYWQITRVDCKDNNSYLKDNLSICGYPNATVDDLKKPDFVQQLIGIQVCIKVKPSIGDYWNTCIERRFYK